MNEHLRLKLFLTGAIFLILVLSFAIVAILYRDPTKEVPGNLFPEPTRETPPNQNTKLMPPAEVNAGQQLPDSPFNDLLTPGLTPEQQTEIIGNILLDYWITNRSLPTGTNEEIFAALGGKNKSGITYAHPGHPALTPDGFRAQGDPSPIRLHVRSSQGGQFDLIHTGPDGLPFTTDDQIRPFPRE